MKKQRTAVYVDGFNLYFGCLRKTSYKWLDLKLLFSTLLDDSHEITKIKYFTASISSRENNHDAMLRQKYYLQALEAYIPEIEIYYGHYLTHSIKAKVVDPKPTEPPFVTVYKTEEKGSDVNLAVHFVNDAWLDSYDCAVLVSNDSDLAEPLRLVKAQHNKNIGLIFPNTDKNRRPSKQLAGYANFIKHIRHHALENSQLPDEIPGTAISKPREWD